MSGYLKYTPAQRLAWGRKMAVAKAVKNAGPVSGFGAYRNVASSARRAPRMVRKPARSQRTRRGIKGRGDYDMDTGSIRAGDYSHPSYHTPGSHNYKYHPSRFEGYGDYKEKKEKGSIGQRVGGAIGSGLGKGVELLIRGLTGFGDYHVAQNSLMDGGLSPPQIINSSNHGGFIVRHREYVGDINASVLFNLTSFPLNPGIASSFPWLSTVAAAFEQYKWRGVVWEFKSLSSDAVLSAATSSALGSVIIATEYNSLNANFPNKAAMNNHEFGNESKPSCDFLHPVECARSLTSVDLLYVRSGAIPAGADIRLYDLGKTEIATVGMQAASGVAGSCWVTYECELYKPQLPEPGVFDPLSDHFKISGATAAKPMLTNVAAIGNTIDGTIANGGDTYVFPPGLKEGQFMIFYNMEGTVASINIPAVTISAFGCSVSTIFKNGTAYLTQVPNATGTNTLLTFTAVVSLFQENASVVVNMSGALPTGAIVGDFIVTQLPDLMQLEQSDAPAVVDDASIEDEDEIPDAIVRFLKRKGIKL